MTPNPTLSPPNDQPGDQQSEDAQLYRRTLHKLLGLASNMAQSLHDEATEKLATYAPRRTPEETQALSVAFDRVARCIRRTILLCQKLAEPPKPPRTKSREAARKRILREVEDAIDREAPAKSAPALHAELLDRLDAPETEDDIENRPIEDIIAEIARDLGVPTTGRAFKWKRRPPEALATLKAQATTPRRASSAPPPRSASGAPPPRSASGAPPPRIAGVPPAKSPGQHPAAP